MVRRPRAAPIGIQSRSYRRENPVATMRLSGSISFAGEISGEPSGSCEGSDDMAAFGSAMDEAAFSELYRKSAAGLRGYIRRACGDAALADDLLQETFYRFLRAKLPRGERRQLKAYLYRIAGSLLADHWRRTKRERRWSADAAEMRRKPAGEPSAETKDETGAMRVFHRLKLQDQTLLWLAYVEGFEHREIAAAVNVGEKSVRVLLFRARKRLENALRKEGAAPAGAAME